MPRYLAKRLLRARCRSARVHDGVESLNSLAAGSACGVGCSGAARAACLSRSESQRSVLRNVREGVRLYGPRPHDLDESGALLGLLRTDTLYEETPCRVAEFDASKLKVLTSEIPVKNISECAPSEITRVLQSPDLSIRRSDAEMESALDGAPPHMAVLGPPLTS